MFLLTLDKVEDLRVLSKIYSTIASYNLQKIAYVIYKPNFETKSYKIKNLIADFLMLDIKELSGVKYEDIEDIIYDILEKEANYIVDKQGASEETISMFDEIADDLGFDEYVDIEKCLDINSIDIGKMSFNDKYITLDFLGYKEHNAVKYTENDFKVRLTILNNGDVFQKNKLLGNVFKVDFITLMFKAKIKDNKKSEISTLFGNYLYEPWYFLNENIDPKDVIKYKMALFDKVKNIEPKDYCYLPQDLTQILNQNYYIQFKDIIEIITGQDKVLKNYY